ncbi:MAG: hypothetical protein RR573_08420 [Oscillospiraceae bacterium]
MYDFLRIQYIMGRITKEKLKSYAPKFISVAMAEEILKGEIIC